MNPRFLELTLKDLVLLPQTLNHHLLMILVVHRLVLNVVGL